MTPRDFTRWCIVSVTDAVDYHRAKKTVRYDIVKTKKASLDFCPEMTLPDVPKMSQMGVKQFSLPGSFFENSTSFADLIGRILDGHIGHRIWQFSFPSQTYFSLITESSIFSGIRESAFDISPEKSRKNKNIDTTCFYCTEKRVYDSVADK